MSPWVRPSPCSPAHPEPLRLIALQHFLQPSTLSWVGHLYQHSHQTKAPGYTCNRLLSRPGSRVTWLALLANIGRSQRRSVFCFGETIICPQSAQRPHVLFPSPNAPGDSPTRLLFPDPVPLSSFSPQTCLPPSTRLPLRGFLAGSCPLSTKP